jgi:hypothetical protein
VKKEEGKGFILFQLPALLKKNIAIAPEREVTVKS